MEALQRILLAQLGVGDGAVGIEHLEHGEAALPVAILDGLERPARVGYHHPSQQVDLLQRAAQRVVGAADDGDQRQPVGGTL